MNKSKLAALVGMSALSAFAVPNAHAADAKILNGAVCQPATSATAVYFTTQGAYTTTSAAYLFCPVPKDNTVSTGGLDDLEVSVSNASGDMFCQAFSLDRYGSALDSKIVYPASGSNKVINFGADINVSDSRGSYTIFCYLGAGDRVHSVYSLEP